MMNDLEILLTYPPPRYATIQACQRGARGKLPQRREIRLDTLQRVLSLGQHTIQRMINDGAFPKPIDNPYAVAWLTADIRRWIGENVQ